MTVVGLPSCNIDTDRSAGIDRRTPAGLTGRPPAFTPTDTGAGFDTVDARTGVVAAAAAATGDAKAATNTLTVNAAVAAKPQPPRRRIRRASTLASPDKPIVTTLPPRPHKPDKPRVYGDCEWPRNAST
ncbi:MAG: hypothetical protein M0Z30_08540 [Actinomycetota bacterium]|nr:hypothetical protein [Actinomycetota bacterium]